MPPRRWKIELRAIAPDLRARLTALRTRRREDLNDLRRINYGVKMNSIKPGYNSAFGIIEAIYKGICNAEGDFAQESRKAGLQRKEF